MRNHTPIGAGTINWLVVPRLSDHGTITAGRRTYRLHDVPAYHDHNWGRWLWGMILPGSGGGTLPNDLAPSWSLLFDRTTNRARTRVLELALALWRGSDLCRVFTQNEIDVRVEGYLTLQRIPKYPRVMALITPETTPDVPHRLHIIAKSDDDYLEGVFEAIDVAQIAIPNGTNLGVTIINEVSGHLKLTGIVHGETVTLEGRRVGTNRVPSGPRWDKTL